MFSTGQVVTVFRSRLRPDAAGYDATAARMSELARTMPGYVDHKTFTADDGERVTVVTFADRSTGPPTSSARRVSAANDLQPTVSEHQDE